MAGDLNAKHTNWNNEVNNQRGMLLVKWYNEIAPFCKTEIYASREPTFPKAGSYLDLCIADKRIIINNGLNYTYTEDYDSDHKAIIFEASLKNENTNIETNHHEPKILNYKKADWNQFQKTLSKNPIAISPHRNYSAQEIERFILELIKNITTALKEAAPTRQQQSLLDRYPNNKIDKEHSEKSKLITALNKTKRLFPANTRLISQLKSKKRR
ncbi:hypothetical protein PV328_004201 [Microctonus aethiopoides]|uniref:Endonuclease/exonuclease/phosphatase domain-containing protein n=1 Tax=Microctonus aethiopoides TaxID=144406 RepID=A0AA39KLF4_9HYME|nr:hypothetical protein PV328_004201 [Microctonus aethiopoides]